MKRREQLKSGEFQREGAREDIACHAEGTSRRLGVCRSVISVKSGM